MHKGEDMNNIVETNEIEIIPLTHRDVMIISRHNNLDSTMDIIDDSEIHMSQTTIQ